MLAMNQLDWMDERNPLGLMGLQGLVQGFGLPQRSLKIDFPLGHWNMKRVYCNTYTNVSTTYLFSRSIPKRRKKCIFWLLFSPFLCSSSYDVIGEEILEILETKEDLWQRKSRTRKLTCKLSHISNSWYESRSSFFPATKFPWVGRTWRDGR